MESEKIPPEQWPLIKQMIAVADEIKSEEVENIKKYFLRPKPIQPQQKEKKANEEFDKIRENNENSGDGDTRRILTYPPSRFGSMGITIADYKCLATDEYLNDVIINFYIRFLYEEVLTPEQRAKTHYFDTFFYEVLMAKSSRETNVKGQHLSVAEKRHQRVQKWTKNINIFEKDFIIVPINRHLHWFLAIICFPGIKYINTGEEKGKTAGKRSSRGRPKTKNKSDNGDNDVEMDDGKPRQAEKDFKR